MHGATAGTTNMIISKDSAVTLAIKLTTAQGHSIESGHLSYLHGGYDNIFPKVEAALEGQTTGFSATLDLAPADAFGERDDKLAIVIPKTEFPPRIKVGGQLNRTGPDGQDHLYNVVKIKGPQVLLDGNHPLAGVALRFALTVTAVRAASTEEITHGHVHGAHGHHHG